MPTKFPIVFAQGLFRLSSLGSPQQSPFNYFRGVDVALRKEGNEVLITRVCSGESLEERACLLKKQIQESFASQRNKINIIAHSMGGLDARYMISKLGMGERVASLVSVSVPHRGSYLAELMLKIGKEFNNQVSLLKIWELLRPEVCSRFNEQVSDISSVAYFSYGGWCAFWQMAPFLWLSFAILLKAEGHNDGLVSASSARWGRYLGNLPSDHLQQVGWDFAITRNKAFKSTRFYLELANFLSRSGF